MLTREGSDGVSRRRGSGAEPEPGMARIAPLLRAPAHLSRRAARPSVGTVGGAMNDQNELILVGPTQDWRTVMHRFTIAIVLVLSCTFGQNAWAQQGEEPIDEFDQAQSAQPGEAGYSSDDYFNGEEPTPEQFEGFESVIINDVANYWITQFDSWGETFEALTYYLVDAGESVSSSCGGATAGDDQESAAFNSAFYCPADSAIFLSTPWMMREMYYAYGDMAVAMVLAHEVAHHVQFQLGITKAGYGSSPGHELQADCLSGTWANSAWYDGLLDESDVDEAINAMEKIEDASRNTHGTRQEREDWFYTGYNDGRPSTCQPPA